MTTTGIPEVFEGTFGCGHEGSVSLTSVPASKRFSRIRYLREKGMCRECFGKARAKERAAEGQRDAVWAREHGFPALTGTEKQVIFGERVRKELLMGAYEVLVQSGQVTEEDFGASVQRPAELVTSAHWWIEAQDVDPARIGVMLTSAPEVQAVAWEEAVGATAIVGTAGQVPFARRVRHQMVEAARAHFVGGGMDARAFSSDIESLAAKVNAARWWLDVREAPPTALPALLADAGHDAYVDNAESS